MTKTIVLTDLFIKQINLDYVRNAVIVLYDMRSADGQTWISSEATFWAVMPPQTPIYGGEDGQTIVGYEPYPASWFLLPAEYIPTLLGLRDDADDALTAALLV